ncbi:MAG: UDP-3-O-acyl-N-acetylglucosamine deacetylase [Chlamydiia bacterium]|nr:UDP-3-O-acyl-N-acetylglucosamine deacetylase [Chlamydiia bacterium]MCH9616541.1 UDP-3-O-acyl-N-acetylglucosamine deacetylase [Chlamydiia bacterium]MCH9629271.1 UDP-3-O-acyl-N-acetylglucosamine deacetylase [Chlamydiia bacterium]
MEPVFTAELDELRDPLEVHMLDAHELSSSREKQRTIEKSVSLSGIGLFTGVRSRVTLHPAPEGTGIQFLRADLAGNPRLPALVENVIGTPRCTILGNDKCSVQTVEHILAALKAFELDNVIIEIDGPEIPSMDGSAQEFVQIIEDAGSAVLDSTKEVYRLHDPIFWSKGDVHLVALPSEEFRISYTLSYPNSELLKSQFYSAAINDEVFKEEIAPARTFSLYEEIVPLIEKGSIKGGNLENAVLIKNDAVLNPDGVRYPDEMARHKILDLIGDLSLVGQSILAHVIAIRSGHFSNTSLARELVNYIKRNQTKQTCTT